MRRTIRNRITKSSNWPKILGFSFIVLCVIYSIGWYVLASHVKSFALYQIEAISKEKAFTFNYTSLKVNGYPFHIELEFLEPKLHTDLGAVIQTPATSDSSSPSPQEVNPSDSPSPSDSRDLAIAPLTESNSAVSSVIEPASNDTSMVDVKYDFSADGKISVRTNLLAKKFTLNLYGKTHYTLSKGAQKWHILLENAASSKTEVAFTGTSFIKSILFPSKYPVTLSSLLKNPFTFSIESKELSLFNGETNDPLKTIESLSASLEQQSSTKPSGTSPVRAQIHLKNHVATKASDMYFRDLSDTFPKFSSVINTLAIASDHGNTNLDFDVTSDLPFFSSGLPISTYMSSKTPFFITIPQATFSSDALQWNSTGSFTVEKEDPAKEELSARFVYHASYELSEKGYDLSLHNIQTSLKQRFSEIIKAHSLSDRDITLLKYLVENPDEIRNIAPSLHNVGKIQLDIDAVAKDSNFTINQADFSTKDYNIKLQGHYLTKDKTATTSLTGKGKMVLKLDNYKKITDDSINYLKRAFTTFDKAYQNGSPAISLSGYLSDSLKTDVNKLLEQCSDAPNVTADNLTITVQNEGDQLLPTIGTLPLFQAAAKAQELLEPHFTRSSEVPTAPETVSPDTGSTSPATLPSQSLPDASTPPSNSTSD